MKLPVAVSAVLLGLLPSAKALTDRLIATIASAAATGQGVVRRALEYLGRGYDLRGAVVSGFAGQFVSGDLAAAAGSPDSFYCSELIAAAFAEAGMPLSGVPAGASTPGRIATAAELAYLGHMPTGSAVAARPTG